VAETKVAPATGAGAKRYGKPWQSQGLFLIDPQINLGAKYTNTPPTGDGEIND